MALRLFRTQSVFKINPFVTVPGEDRKVIDQHSYKSNSLLTLIISEPVYERPAQYSEINLSINGPFRSLRFSSSSFPFVMVISSTLHMNEN